MGPKDDTFLAYSELHGPNTLPNQNWDGRAFREPPRRAGADLSSCYTAGGLFS